MSYTTYQLIHVISAFLLCAFTFMACASASSGKNKRVLMFSGILAVTMFVAGFGLMARLKLGFAENPWLWVKIACWLALSGVAGMAYKKPEKAGAYTAMAMISIVIAVVMVYTRPF